MRLGGGRGSAARFPAAEVYTEDLHDSVWSGRIPAAVPSFNTTESTRTMPAPGRSVITWPRRGPGSRLVPGWGDERWGEAPDEAHLPPETVLNQMEMAVIVCDRFSNVIYGNDFARRLFGFGGDEIIGHSVLSLGIAEEDHEQATELARHVLKGGVWEGTFCNLRADGTTVYTRAHAVPLRHPSGAVEAW